MAASVGRQTTLFGRVRQSGVTGGEVCRLQCVLHCEPEEWLMVAKDYGD